MKTLLCTLALSGALLAGAAQANTISHDDCNISLNYDLTYANKTLSVSEQQHELYRIEGDQLFVDGKPVTLTAKQQQLVSDYRAGVFAQMPKVIGLVDDAMDIATDAVGTSLQPLLGDEGSAKLQQAMENLHQRLSDLAYHRGDTYFVGASEDAIEEAFDDEFSDEIEQVVMSSMGSVLMNIGKTMMNGDWEDFGAKMDRMGDEIEARVDAKSQVLERHADELCVGFSELQVQEQQLQQQIPALARYTLIDTDSDKQ